MTNAVAAVRGLANGSRPGGRPVSVLSGARVVTPTGVIDGGWVQVEAGVITAVGSGTSAGRRHGRPGRRVVAAGLHRPARPWRRRA